MTEKKQKGRPKKEPTKVISFRVPEDKAEFIKDKVDLILKEW